MARPRPGSLVVQYHGSIALLVASTRRARNWLMRNCCAESWQWMGHALACEPRYAADIVNAFYDEEGV